MGGKRRKKPEPLTASEAFDQLDEALGRKDYFHGDMDEGGIRITPPTEDWKEE